MRIKEVLAHLNHLEHGDEGSRLHWQEMKFVCISFKAKCTGENLQSGSSFWLPWRCWNKYYLFVFCFRYAFIATPTWNDHNKFSVVVNSTEFCRLARVRSNKKLLTDGDYDQLWKALTIANQQRQRIHRIWSLANINAWPRVFYKYTKHYFQMQGVWFWICCW